MQLNLARYQWKMPSPVQNRGLDSVEGLSATFLDLAWQRGIKDLEQLEVFLDRDPQVYHDSLDMHDMDKASQRIQAAISRGEKILVYGDYDADGVTASLILWEAIQTLGGQVDYYLPNRFTDGYGPNLDRYRDWVHKGIQVIVTVDNGVAGFEAIDWAQDQGVDVIVTDHHQIQDKLPEAYAIVHPAHPDGRYPFGDLAGAGVALKLASVLLGEIPQEGLELAAIGTVADMVSLTDENRTIVVQGLKAMTQTQRIGLAKLLEAQKVRPESLSAETIGFIIGPRLNAAGRLASPDPAFQLLATSDPGQAQALLDEIEGLNDQRKSLVQAIVDDVKGQLDHDSDLPLALVKTSPNWHEGVLGIAASQLAKTYHRPVLLFTEKSKEGVYKGSGRSIPGIDLFTALQDLQDHLKYFGGHAQAAGLTLDREAYAGFKEGLESWLEPHRKVIYQAPRLEVDLSIDLDQVTDDLIDQLDLLGPYGMDNPQPCFHIGDVQVSEVKRIGQDHRHLKLSVTDGQGKDLQVIGFNRALQGQWLREGDRVHLVGQLQFNEWQGQRIPQLLLEDLGQEGSLWIDVRGSSIPRQLWKLDQALFVFRQPERGQAFQGRLQSRCQVFSYGQSLKDWKACKYLVVMEPPRQLEDLAQIIRHKPWSYIFLGSYLTYSKYLLGLPQRDEAIKVYQWVQARQGFSIPDQLEDMAGSLAIPPLKIKWILFMFSQAKFVKIEDGDLTFLPPRSGQKLDLTRTPAYQGYKEEMEVEALLNYQTLDRIKDYFERN